MNSKMTVVKDAYTDISDVLLFSKIADKYNTCVPNLYVKGISFPDIKEEITAMYPGVSIVQFKTNKVHETWVFEHEEFLFLCESLNGKKQYSFDVYTNSYEQQNTLYNFLKKFEDTKADSFIGIYSYYLSGTDLKDSYMAKQAKDFTKLKPAFYPYLDIKEMFNQFILSEDNMLVLTGKPGTGKTKLIDEYLNYLLTSDLVQEKLEIKKEKEKLSERESQPTGIELQDWLESIEDRVNDMFDNDEIAVVYVKNENVLSTDEFWNQLKSSEYQLVILDDLDYALLPRTQAVSSGEDVSKNAFISQLLSFTDGIFENGNNTKFIITTNRDVSEIDTAVLRKGRTFDILNLRYLTPDEALNIWKDEYELSEEDFDECLGDRTEIPASDLGAFAKDLINARLMGVDTKPYILEDGISQYKTLNTETKIGML